MRPLSISRCCRRSPHACLNDELVVDVFRTSNFRRGVFKGVNMSGCEIDVIFWIRHVHNDFPFRKLKVSRLVKLYE